MSSAPDRQLTVLVLGVGGNVSQGILKALAAGSLPVRVLAGCIDPLSMGLHLADGLRLSPRADDDAFPLWLTDVCQEEGVDVVMSGAEPVLDALATHAAHIREATGAVCLVSPPDVLALGADKLATARWMTQRGLPSPRSADGSDAEAVRDLLEARGLPVVVKPRAGKGAEGVTVVRDEAELRRLLSARPGLMVQERLEGDEFSVGCVCDAEGVVRGTFPMRRELRDGTTVRAEAGEFPEVSDYAERIARELGPTGPLNVQLRTPGGDPVAFELNVRFSGTTPMRVRLGFDEVEACLRHFALGEPLRLGRGRHGTVVRYWNELYLPAEDGGAPFVENWGMRP